MKRVTVLLSLCLCANLSAADATEPPTRLPSLKKFAIDVEALVHQYYPEAQLDATDQVIQFAFKTREFMIHLPTMDGQWQDARPMRGPDRGGILGIMEVRPGHYDGQWMGGTLDRYYFQTSSVMQRGVPYSAKYDCYLNVSLDYPKDANPEFLDAFRHLVESFEQYVE